MSSPVHPRIAAVALAAVLALAGCSATNAITTQFDYAASDGIHERIGQVGVVNFLVVAPAAGEDGVLIGSLINNGRTDVEVTLGANGTAATTYSIAAGEILYFGPEDGQEMIVVSETPFPGLMVPVIVFTAETGPVTLDVPVMDATLPEYADVLAKFEANAPTPEPSPSPEPSPEPSPAASPSPEPESA